LPVTRSRQAALPRYVSAEVVEKIIGACSPERICGVRDRAILLLLARLGLRADDVVKLRLDDLDWERARLRVAGKGRREAWLPIPQDVGDAVIKWLRKRPRISSDRVFLTGIAPWQPLANGGTVGAIVVRAIRWAGVATPTRGAHLLRHSAATTMLRRGMSLLAIGTVLRHQSIDTTVLYARVDVNMLRRVAQPWIGAASC
jgi:integrase